MRVNSLALRGLLQDAIPERVAPLSILARTPICHLRVPSRLASRSEREATEKYWILDTLPTNLPDLSYVDATPEAANVIKLTATEPAPSPSLGTVARSPSYTETPNTNSMTKVSREATLVGDPKFVPSSPGGSSAGGRAQPRSRLAPK